MALVRAVRVWASEKLSEWAGERGSGRKDECLLGAFLCQEEKVLMVLNFICKTTTDVLHSKTFHCPLQSILSRFFPSLCLPSLLHYFLISVSLFLSFNCLQYNINDIKKNLPDGPLQVLIFFPGFPW